ncbi:MAG TPA: SbcC/MukB-like Walker B domain-containing protein, partial [Pseudonocardiaceae bacterium]|nr:SbcC/MukB-like Walker B domain-containing protein [Pseudonocardiaceae bacterium]
ALAQLTAALPAVEAEAAAAKRSYRLYSGLVSTRLATPCPADEDAFEELRSQLPDIRNAAAAAAPDAERTRTTALKQYADTAHEHRQAEAELTALQSASNLIPAGHARRRDRIAVGAGLPPADLPYAAELIDIADGQERWRPAAEKVARSFGLRLLVPERHKDAVRRYVDENDMRAVVEYSIITSVSAHRPTPKPNSLAAKLTVDRDHPCGPWLAVQVVNRFEHMCVETARELEPHRLAVTVRGTVKLAGNHYRKDDRPDVASPSSYILGANTVAKRLALQTDVDRLAAQVKRDHTAADAADAELRNLQDRTEAVDQLLDYTSWPEIDQAGAAKRVHAIQEQIEAIKANNVNLRELEAKKDRAFAVWKKKLQVSGNTERDIADAGRRQTTLVDLRAEEERRPHRITDEEHREYLGKVLAAIDGPDQPEDMPRVRTAFRRELDQRRREADAERSRAEAKIKTAIDRFIQQWPDTAPDTTGEVDRCGQDYVALYQDIIQRRLHEAMEKFKHIISEDMVPSIAVLQRAIETSTGQIKDRIAMVNDALNRVQFNPGTFLQIAYKASLSDDVKTFRAQVDDLLRNASASRRGNRESLAQFQRVQRLMATFIADTTEAKRWRANVLDVRNGFSFYAREIDHEGVTRATHSNTAVNSGGEQEKFVAFCLAAALSYNLADTDSGGMPRFAPLMLDEAFSKSDEEYAAQALSVFDEFGFQLLIAAPIRMSGIVEPFIGQAILVEKRITADGAHSNAASATFGEIAARRSAEIDGASGAHT